MAWDSQSPAVPPPHFRGMARAIDEESPAGKEAKTLVATSFAGAKVAVHRPVEQLSTWIPFDWNCSFLLRLWGPGKTLLGLGASSWPVVGSVRRDAKENTMGKMDIGILGNGGRYPGSREPCVGLASSCFG